MSAKRIVFSTNTPNDQGFRIPNDVLNFDRYVKNPVILKQHKWDELPLGKMTDIKFENGEWTGVPEFHRLTADSNEYADLWDAGFLNACSIGGFKTLKTTGKFNYVDGQKIPEVYLDQDGMGVADLFDLYEISMVTLPSNLDAVAKDALLSAKCYDEINIQAIETQITLLGTKLTNMETEAEKATRLAAEATKLTADKPVEQPKEADKLSAQVLPPPIKEIVADNETKKAGLWATFKSFLEGMGEDKPNENKLLGAEPTPKDLPITKSGEDVIFTTDPKLPSVPNKLEAEKAEKLQKASTAINAALEAKEKAEKIDATEEEKAEYASKKKEAEDALKACDAMEVDDAGEAEADGMKAKEKEKSTQSAQPKKITLKTMDELRADGAKLADKPQLSVKFNAPAGISLSKLKADDNGKKLIDRVQNAPVEQKNIQEVGVYLAALRNEPKYKQVFDKVRLMQNISEDKLSAFRSSPNAGAGLSVDHLINKLQSGVCSVWGKDNVMREATTLTATDNFLASPDLFAVDFLDLAIFKLFPTNSWKDQIAIFGAQETENNTGIIWANITANPAVYMGDKPAVTDYTYTDTAVSLNLTPYWLQPMLWTPLTMHQLRYDQMSTGWAQAFAVFGTFIDDNLIYTLASTVPHQSIVYSTGVTQQVSGTQQFTLNGNADDPNAFYYNPLFAGTLNQPTLNDVIRVEQIYNKQNFQLENEKPVAVIDPTTDSLIAQSAQTQSLLTRWVDENGKDLTKFKHTMFHQRSRVAVFDPTTAQVKNPNSSIPNSAVSANLCFIPSQVGIGLGKLDVFMIQDPSQYGYRMSADVRMGIVPLRADYSGTALWTYGPQKVS